MAARRGSSLLAFCISAAVVLGMVIFLEASVGAFVSPRGTGASSQTGSVTSMADLKQPFRLHTTVESGPGGPQKINLLFIGTLAGTAVIGLIALFAYGAYSGSGSGL